MRRKHSEVTDTEKIDQILLSATIGRLATNGADGYPYITPVNFVYYRGNIYFHCAPKGEKLDNIARNPKVCFQVDIPLAYLGKGYNLSRNSDNICGLHQFYHCVIIRGEARVVPDSPLKIDALNELIASHENHRDFEKVHGDLPAYHACTVVEIRPETISAKSDLHQKKSAEERLAMAKYLKTGRVPKGIETIKAFGFDPAEI
ncbi:MAG: pyridoxamine 5'-phosphate oxidase family protein [Desulfobacterales bacterium]|nr:pyridoxamine 5'-phosphate oxidase family protein [Desulfobacterales bacterium]